MYNLILDLSYIVRRAWKIAVDCDPRQLPSEPISKKEANTRNNGRNGRKQNRAQTNTQPSIREVCKSTGRISIALDQGGL
jgi:hypothetical protein